VSAPDCRRAQRRGRYDRARRGAAWDVAAYVVVGKSAGFEVSDVAATSMSRVLGSRSLRNRPARTADLEPAKEIAA
jgi:hypothetical protein